MLVRDLFKDKVFTFSNILTMFRIITVPFIGYFLYLENKTGDTSLQLYILIGYLVIIFSDFFDGTLARLLNQESRLGQFLDPVADKISTIAVGTLLCMYKGFPLWLLVMAFVREISFFIAGILFYMKKDVQVKPNVFGKLYAGTVAFAAFVYTFNTLSIFSYKYVKFATNTAIVVFYVLGVILYIKTYFSSDFLKENA